jgi:signal transduction histidine kinase
MSTDDGMQLLQLVREALSNTARHAEAHRALVRLARGDGATSLEIADDGVGFDTSAASPVGHHGMRNMRTRAESIGAMLVLESDTVGGGTRIILTMPDPTPSQPAETTRA